MSTWIDAWAVLALAAAQASGPPAVSPEPAPGKRALVLLFTRTDCPISNRYAPDVRRLYEQFGQQGVEFRLVYPERYVSSADIERHRREYSYPFGAIADPSHSYVQAAGVEITPEAAVYVRGQDGKVQFVYRGRIDDRHVSLAIARPKALTHDLEDVLRAVVAGTPLRFRATRSVGCSIRDLR